MARYSRIVFSVNFWLMSSSISMAFAWENGTREESDGTKCYIQSLANYRGATPYPRQHPIINLLVSSLQPLKTDFSVTLGYDSPLKTVGAMKVGDNLFKLTFNGDIGKLADEKEEAALLSSIRTNEKAVIGFKVSETYVFDSYHLQGLDQKLDDLKAICEMKG